MAFVDTVQQAEGMGQMCPSSPLGHESPGDMYHPFFIQRSPHFFSIAVFLEDIRFPDAGKQCLACKPKGGSGLLGSGFLRFSPCLAGSKAGTSWGRVW